MAGSGPFTPTPVSEAIAAPGRFLNWVASSAVGLVNQVLDGANFCGTVNSIASGQEPLPLALFDQQPILDLINGNLNLQLVNEWAARAASSDSPLVGLLSGRVRYATQNGQLLERDNSTVVYTLPTFQPVPPACQSQASYVTELENQLSALMTNRPSPGDPDYESWLAQVNDLNIHP